MHPTLQDRGQLIRFHTVRRRSHHRSPPGSHRACCKAAYGRHSADQSLSAFVTDERPQNSGVQYASAARLTASRVGARPGQDIRCPDLAPLELPVGHVHSHHGSRPCRPNLAKAADHVLFPAVQTGFGRHVGVTRAVWKLGTSSEAPLRHRRARRQAAAIEQDAPGTPTSSTKCTSSIG